MLRTLFCHSGARAKQASPESIITDRRYGFRARVFGASRNDDSLELHARRLLELRAVLAAVEELALAETEHAGEQRGRELLDAGVIFLHRVIVEAARGGELVLDVGEVRLQL